MSYMALIKLPENEKRWLSLLQAYVNREGHTDVPVGHVEDGRNLGDWVAMQRIRYNHGVLKPNTTVTLEAIPHWHWGVDAPKAKAAEPQQITKTKAVATDEGPAAPKKNTYDAKFDAALEKLRRFVAREGHTDVPRKHKEDGFGLGAWVWFQRSSRLRLDDNRVAALEVIPRWHWGADAPQVKAAHYDAKFYAALEKLHCFVAREGHADVPRKHREDGFGLGLWVLGKRYNKHLLNDDRVAALEQTPGWTWVTSKGVSKRFSEKIAALKKFVRREGHACPRQDHIESGVMIGIWVSNQRTLKRVGRLTPEKIALLESVPGWSYCVNNGVKYIERNAEIVSGRKASMTLKTLGEMHGISSERVRQILNRSAISSDVDESDNINMEIPDNRNLNIPYDDLSNVAANALKINRLETLNQLCDIKESDFLRMERVGRVVVHQVREMLTKHGMSFRQDLRRDSR